MIIFYHIDNERIIDVLYRDHDYTVSNFDEQHQIIHQWFNVWGMSEQDYEIGEPERELGIRYIQCWNNQGKSSDFC